MPYVRENGQGELERVEPAPFAGMTGQLPADDARVQVWLAREEVRAHLNRLRDSDLELVRVLEDLVGILVGRGLILYTDLPEAARRKLEARAGERAGLGGLSDLLGDDDGPHLP